jgi:hypothetical protein
MQRIADGRVKYQIAKKVVRKVRMVGENLQSFVYTQRPLRERLLRNKKSLK